MNKPVSCKTLTNPYAPGWGVKLDYSIAELILNLNTLRYSTFSCCSGLPDDHKKGSGNTFYVIFRVKKLPDFLVSLIDPRYFIYERGKIEGVPSCRVELALDRNISDKMAVHQTKRLINRWNKRVDKEIALLLNVRKIKP